MGLQEAAFHHSAIGSIGGLDARCDVGEALAVKVTSRPFSAQGDVEDERLRLEQPGVVGARAGVGPLGRAEGEVPSDVVVPRVRIGSLRTQISWDLVLWEIEDFDVLWRPFHRNHSGRVGPLDAGPESPWRHRSTSHLARQVVGLAVEANATIACHKLVIPQAALLHDVGVELAACLARVEADRGGNIVVRILEHVHLAAVGPVSRLCIRPEGRPHAAAKGRVAELHCKETIHPRFVGGDPHSLTSERLSPAPSDSQHCVCIMRLHNVVLECSRAVQIFTGSASVINLPERPGVEERTPREG